MTYSYDYHNTKTVQQQQSGAIASIIVKNHLYNTGNDTTHLYSHCLCCFNHILLFNHTTYTSQWISLEMKRTNKYLTDSEAPEASSTTCRPLSSSSWPHDTVHVLVTSPLLWIEYCEHWSCIDTCDCTIQLSPLQNQCIHTSMAYRHLSSILYLHKYNFSYTLLASICETGSLTPFHASRNVAVR